MISNSGSDSRGKYSGDTAGDQTGKEWYIRSWYNRPWNCILRYPDETARKKIAELSIKAANNNKIGYDQNERDTYWTQLQKAGYDPSKITVACEADCSAGVCANVKAVGHLLGIASLQNLSATYTGNMRSGFKAAGFQVLTDSKYLTSENYLVAGDVLLNDQCHTAVEVGSGTLASLGTSVSGTSSTTSSTASSAASGTIRVDGYWGKDTTTKAQAVFKKLGYSVTIDGIVSNQDIKYKPKNPGLEATSWDWQLNPSGGSQLIRAIQSWCGGIAITGMIDDATIKAMQKKFGTTQDGYVSSPSDMVKAFQKWLNSQ